MGRRSQPSKPGIFQGVSYTRLYQTHKSMLDRCNNPKSHIFNRYGGRGIKVCDEWANNYEAFMEWAFANGYTDELTIDRIDVNGNYSPENCRWADKKVQLNNTRRNHFVECNGEHHTLAEWEEITKISQKTLERRINTGWDVEKALTLPPSRVNGKQGKHRNKKTYLKAETEKYQNAKGS